MKEQDAAHSLDGYNKNDANLCPVMNGYYCFDRACGIDHKKQCMMINPKDKIYVDGSKAGDYIQQHIAYRREMEMNYAKMQDELTRLRSELQQERARVAELKKEIERLTPIEFSNHNTDGLTMDMTEKRTAEEIPFSLIELLHAHSINTEFVAAANKMYVTSAPLPYFEAACKMYAAQELDAYKARLKNTIAGRNDYFILLDIIDTV